MNTRAVGKNGRELGWCRANTAPRYTYDRVALRLKHHASVAESICIPEQASKDILTRFSHARHVGPAFGSPSLQMKLLEREKRDLILDIQERVRALKVKEQR